MLPYKAFIFDMNGTMVDDMRYHEKAWYDILVGDLNAPLTPRQVKEQLYGKNEELFDRVFGKGSYAAEEVGIIALKKEAKYREDFLPHLAVIPGLDNFLANSKADGIQLAIGTAAIRPNVDFVLDNLALRDFFQVIVGPEDVTVSKPDPEVFLKAAAALGVDPTACVVFEDSPKGIEAARRAGMKAVAITSYHTAEELIQDNVLLYVQNYEDPSLKTLFS